MAFTHHFVTYILKQHFSIVDYLVNRCEMWCSKYSISTTYPWYIISFTLYHRLVYNLWHIPSIHLSCIKRFSSFIIQVINHPRPMPLRKRSGNPSFPHGLKQLQKFLHEWWRTCHPPGNAAKIKESWWWLFNLRTFFSLFLATDNAWRLINPAQQTSKRFTVSV